MCVTLALKALCSCVSVLMNGFLKCLIRWSLRMSLQSLMVHTAWMGCGSSATPLSLFPNTGATAFCLLSLVSPWPCSGASCLLASPSATSGLWCPASRAAWLSRSAWAASTPFASRPSAIPSLKPWARSSAVFAWHCAKKSKNSCSSVCSVIGWSVVSFYTPEDQTWHLACCPILFLHLDMTCCSPPSQCLTHQSESWHAHCGFCQQKFCDSWSRQCGSPTALALLEKGPV